MKRKKKYRKRKRNRSLSGSDDSSSSSGSLSSTGKPHHSTLDVTPKEKKTVENDREQTPEKCKESENDREQTLERSKELIPEAEEDEEIVIKRPKTPLSKTRRLTIETPEVDLERFRPQRFNLDATNPLGWDKSFLRIKIQI